jgi:tetratricopeptide (TPR) repeat protein
VTNQSLESYREGVQEKIEKRYSTLRKNVYFYLCYTFLELQDFNQAIKYGEILLETNHKDKLSIKTHFTVLQYLAEASCMLGQTENALAYLDLSEKLSIKKPAAKDQKKAPA